MSGYEQVSVIIPTYNEQDSITNCIETLIDGDYPIDKLEFIIADGGSTDNTLKEIEHFSRRYPDVSIKVLHNPHKTQGHGLNMAIQNVSADSKIIIRADAHSVYPRNYIAHCVESLLTTNADNIGGVMVPLGKGALQRAVSFCMSHPLGVGNAQFHLGNQSGFVDTAYLGCFKRDVFERIGLFDPAMTPNEDAELNLRIRKSGGTIYLNHKIRVGYFPRDTMAKLMKQYYRYGQGRCRTSKKHKAFTSIRQVIPLIWVVFTVVLLVLSLFSVVFFIPLLGYFVILLSISIFGVCRRKDIAIFLSPICFSVMHYAWGIGFFSELLHAKR